MSESKQRLCRLLEPVEGKPDLPKLYVHDGSSCHTLVVSASDPVDKALTDRLSRILANETFRNVNIMAHIGRAAFSVLPSLDPDMDVRVLLRLSTKSPEKIRYHAETLSREADFSKLNMNIRLYSEDPSLRYFLLRNQTHAIAIFGVYGWSSGRKRYEIGDKWSGMILDSLEPTQKMLINALCKRFDHLWDQEREVI